MQTDENGILFIVMEAGMETGKSMHETRVSRTNLDTSIDTVKRFLKGRMMNIKKYSFDLQPYKKTR